MYKEKVINELTNKLISEIESNGIISVTEMFDYNSLNESLINIKKEIKDINSNEIRNQVIENIETYGYEIHFKILKSGISNRYIFYTYFTKKGEGNIDNLLNKLIKNKYKKIDIETEINKELKNLNYFYEKGEISNEGYDDINFFINNAKSLYGKYFTLDKIQKLRINVISKLIAKNINS
ncbi:MAG: hypothetical protein E6147_05975 [Peptostreptococcus sp.]|nr:hypothetical protein [Peptostreptococcus sp.]MDU5350525.1 hypothetical protein [Peptostreptococcus sp.]MDU5891989.1 hypothetical protein [Peptostreptococcus sp.]